MKRFFLAVPFLLVAAGLGSGARGQETDNQAIAAAKKAALVVEVTGTAPVKPTSFYLHANLFAEGKGRASVRAEYQKSLKAMRGALKTAGLRAGGMAPGKLLLVTGETSYREVRESDPEGPGDVYRLVGASSVAVSTAPEARAVIAAMRASGAQGEVTVAYGLADEETARPAALKAALSRAKQRVQILSEAARPKTFELVYLKEGEFRIPPYQSIISLRGDDSVTLLTTIGAEARLTLFYAFKPAPPAAKTAVRVAAKPFPKP